MQPGHESRKCGHDEYVSTGSQRSLRQTSPEQCQVRTHVQVQFGRRCRWLRSGNLECLRGDIACRGHRPSSNTAGPILSPARDLQHMAASNGLGNDGMEFGKVELALRFLVDPFVLIRSSRDRSDVPLSRLVRPPRKVSCNRFRESAGDGEGHTDRIARRSALVRLPRAFVKVQKIVVTPFRRDKNGSALR
jgi:hypothetical protein